MRDVVVLLVMYAAMAAFLFIIVRTYGRGK